MYIVTYSLIFNYFSLYGGIRFLETLQSRQALRVWWHSMRFAKFWGILKILANRNEEDSLYKLTHDCCNVMYFFPSDYMFSSYHNPVAHNVQTLWMAEISFGSEISEISHRQENTGLVGARNLLKDVEGREYLLETGSTSFVSNLIIRKGVFSGQTTRTGTADGTQFPTQPQRRYFVSHL